METRASRLRFCKNPARKKCLPLPARARANAFAAPRGASMPLSLLVLLSLGLFRRARPPCGRSIFISRRVVSLRTLLALLKNKTISLPRLRPCALLKSVVPLCDPARSPAVPARAAAPAPPLCRASARFLARSGTPLAIKMAPS